MAMGKWLAPTHFLLPEGPVQGFLLTCIQLVLPVTTTKWELHCPYSKDEKSEVLEVTSVVRPEDCRSQPLKGRSSWR